jgi:hypothetical protein
MCRRRVPIIGKAARRDGEQSREARLMTEKMSIRTGKRRWGHLFGHLQCERVHRGAGGHRHGTSRVSGRDRHLPAPEVRGVQQEEIAAYAFLAAAISTPLGTLFSYPFIDRIARPTLGILLAVSAGALVYVGASHFLPEVEKENRRFSMIALAVGVLVAVAIVMSKQ